MSLTGTWSRMQIDAEFDAFGSVRIVKAHNELVEKMTNNKNVCRTCCKPISAPYRVYDDHGKVIQGCIDADHDGGGLI